MNTATLRSNAASLAGVLLLASACLANSDGKIATITAEGLHTRLQSAEKPLVVDVREPSEFEGGHIEGAVLAPLGSVENDLERVQKDQEIVLVCRSGRRSGEAYERLAARGFTKLWNMEGGMIAWEKAGYPVAKK